MTSELRERAARLRALHDRKQILVLPNAWDPASARLFASVGSLAIGTTSAGVSYTLGHPDGEVVSRDEMIEACGRIARAVAVPVTGDLESGFAADIRGLVETIEMTLAAGMVGANLEDVDRGARALYSVEDACDRIRAAREVGARAGIPLVINARTDVYLLQVGEPGERLAHAIRRANAYLAAGADCAFVPGVRDAETIGALARGITGPLNVLAGLGTPPVRELERLGVARVSVGSGPMHAIMSLTRRIGQELIDDGTFTFLDGAMTYPEANALMRAPVGKPS